MMFFWGSFIEGLSIAFSLIIAIGIQNAFVLKQGILKNHPLLIAFLCSSIDAILITFGVYGFGEFLTQHPLLLKIFSWGGVLFVFAYSALAFYSSFKPHSLNINNQPKITSIRAIFLKVFFVSIINPNAFLDSVVLMGSISAQLPKEHYFSFTLGASSASFIWFFILSFAARFLQPFFSKPKAWKILDFIIGCTMLCIFLSLLKKLDLSL